MIKMGLTGLLVLTFLGLNLSKVAFCENSLLFSKDDKKKITRHEPRIMTTPEIDIPMVRVKEQKGKMRYLWYGLGTAALLGLVAAATGGGGGGDDDDGGGTSDDGTGNIAVGW